MTFHTCRKKSGKRLLQACIAAIGFLANTAAHTQTISYLIPDIGTPGMNTYVELIGPYNANGNFGTDGLYLNNPNDAVQVVCAKPADTQFVRFGPCVVSWDGKMISTQAFVLPNVNATSDDWQEGIKIPIQVEVNGISSNVDTFYIVKPQILGINGILSSPGVLGSGMQAGINWGLRSRRGAMIVDTLNLSGNGIYSVSTQDCDSGTPGNQGYLPFVLLSKGNISINGNATFSVNANDSSGGPGGGGGGNGLICGSLAGDGFSGGGMNNDLCKPQTGCTYQPPPSTGSGDSLLSLNGIPAGGYSSYNEGGGGGTGHPFGKSGGPGNGADSTSAIPPGYGGGSGGPYCCWDPSGWGYQGGGGGGGFALNGNEGGVYEQAFSAGSIVGNAELVPVAGGSGGGGGNLNSDPHSTVGAGNGGGGGGCIIVSCIQFSITGQVTSLGGAGVSSSTNGAGGGGSGGAEILYSKLLPTSIPTLNVEGGVGGSGFPVNVGQDGGSGSSGRIRIDGPSAQQVNFSPNNASLFRGPSTDTSRSVARTFTLSGTGNGDSIRLYLRPISGKWFLDTTLGGYVGNKWNSTITLPGDDTIYFLAAAQQVPSPSSDTFTSEPNWVMSQAAANILSVAACEITSVVLDSTTQTAGHEVHILLSAGGLPIPPNTDSMQFTLQYNNDLLSYDSVIRGCVDSVKVEKIDSMHTSVTLYFPPGYVFSDSSCVVADIVTTVMATRAESTDVVLESLSTIASGISTLASTCSTNSFFTISNACGDSTLRQFMETGTLVGSLSASPNPVSEFATVTFTTAESSIGEVSIFNLLGAEVARLYEGELAAGEHSFTWDASGAAAGMYECVVRVNGNVQRVPLAHLR
jgi:hypothetical protein